MNGSFSEIVDFGYIRPIADLVKLIVFVVRWNPENDLLLYVMFTLLLCSLSLLSCTRFVYVLFFQAYARVILSPQISCTTKMFVFTFF